MAGCTVLSTLVLLLSGWLAGAESASWALLQPVVARLDDTPQIRMQQGMLRTFGRVMPIPLPLTSVLIVLTAVVAPRWSSAGALGGRRRRRGRAHRLHPDGQRAHQQAHPHLGR
jgi:hypothetical protein